MGTKILQTLGQDVGLPPKCFFGWVGLVLVGFGWVGLGCVRLVGLVGWLGDWVFGWLGGWLGGLFLCFFVCLCVCVLFRC